MSLIVCNIFIANIANSYFHGIMREALRARILISPVQMLNIEKATNSFLGNLIL